MKYIIRREIAELPRDWFQTGWPFHAASPAADIGRNTGDMYRSKAPRSGFRSCEWNIYVPLPVSMNRANEQSNEGIFAWAHFILLMMRATARVAHYMGERYAIILHHNDIDMTPRHGLIGMMRLHFFSRERQRNTASRREQQSVWAYTEEILMTAKHYERHRDKWISVNARGSEHYASPFHVDIGSLMIICLLVSYALKLKQKPVSFQSTASQASNIDL